MYNDVYVHSKPYSTRPFFEFCLLAEGCLFCTHVLPQPAVLFWGGYLDVFVAFVSCLCCARWEACGCASPGTAPKQMPLNRIVFVAFVRSISWIRHRNKRVFGLFYGLKSVTHRRGNACTP